MARRRSSTSISATRPVFPSYLLSSFDFVFHRRRSSASTASSASSASCASAASSPSSSSATTPASSPISKHGVSDNFLARRLSRNAPDTLRCSSCSADVALATQIISKGFTGRYGRAFLVAPPSPSGHSLLNTRIGRSEDRHLVTGWHVVADICCATCSRKLGWKYVDAKEQSQKYKVGKYILETERVTTHRSWEDFAVENLGFIDEEAGFDGVARISLGGSDSIVFDSDDDNECEEIFAGTWDAATVARRRSQSAARGTPLVN